MNFFAKSTLTIVALVILAGCSSNTAGIGNPIGTDTNNFIVSSPDTVTFASLTSSAQNLSLLAGPLGTTVTESDNCGAVGSRIVRVSSIVDAGSQKYAASVTPEMTGSCTLKFSNASGAYVNVSVTVN